MDWARVLHRKHRGRTCNRPLYQNKSLICLLPFLNLERVKLQ